MIITFCCTRLFKVIYHNARYTCSFVHKRIAQEMIDKKKRTERERKKEINECNAA